MGYFKTNHSEFNVNWANYRAACRAKSTADFINKLKIVEEEADETQYWLEVIEESKLINAGRIETIKKEVNEIVSIVVASIKTIREKENRKSKVVNQKSKIKNQKSKIKNRKS